jgi:hypothetical protein
MTHCSNTRPLAHFPTIAMLCSIAMLWGNAAPLHAQVTNLDKGRLIDQLQREGMRELLLHLVEVEPPKDPVEGQMIVIAQLRLKADELGDQAVEAAQEDDPVRQQDLLRLRDETYDEVIKAYQKLIAEHNQHEQRPLWQTDFAEMLLYNYLLSAKLNANEFYDLGSPSTEQREAFERAIPLAWESLSDADQRFYQLQTELPRDPPAVHNARINSGLWSRMMEDYYAFRTQFFTGQAAYYASLLPDSNTYYSNLGNNQRVPFQERTPDAERKRLRDLAVNKLEPFATDAADRRGIKLDAMTFQARAMTLNGQYEAAIALLDQVIEANKTDLTHLVASLTKGRAMAGDKQGLAAMDHLTRVEFHPLAANVFVRLLIVDQQHQVLLKTSPDSAYDPYLNLLADRNIPEDVREFLKVSVIYPRWADAIPDGADLGRQPPVVLAAIGELARSQGQDIWNQALVAEQGGRADRAQQLNQDANVKFDRAIRLLGTVLQRENLSPAIRAKALLNLAYAEYFKDPMNADVLLKAAKLWMDMAETLPEAPEAVEAVGNAEAALRPIFDQGSGPPGIRDAYMRATGLLFEKFPQSPQANNARFYYAFTVLMPAGKYAEAAQMFKEVPNGHPTYSLAQSEWVVAMQKLYENSPPADRARTRAEAIEAAEFVLEETERNLVTAQPAEATALKETKGWVTLALFDLRVAEGKVSDALKLLEGFDSEHADTSELIVGMYERRIVQLAQANQNTALEEQARQMMLKAPENAAPVIDGVLNRLESEIDHLRSEANKPENIANAPTLRAQAANRATTAATLAELLLQWAQRQGFNDEEMLPYQLISVKALRLSGQVDQALAQIEPIARNEAFENNATVVQEYAEALFASGLREGQVHDRDTLVRSAKQFETLIYAYSTGPFPPLFWNAWMRWMQIADSLNEGTTGIPQRIRELRAFDPNLGGEPYRSELLRLETKHVVATR